MTISLVLPDDERAKILVELPHKLKNGHVKTVQIWLPKLDYISRDVMDDHRKWVRERRQELEVATEEWNRARIARISDKTVEVPEPPEPFTEIEQMRDLARRLIPEEWDKYLEHLPRGVKKQLITEWAQQSAVTPGESEASSTSSDDQE